MLLSQQLTPMRKQMEMLGKQVAKEWLRLPTRYRSSLSQDQPTPTPSCKGGQSQAAEEAPPARSPRFKKQGARDPDF